MPNIFFPSCADTAARNQTDKGTAKRLCCGNATTPASVASMSSPSADSPFSRWLDSIVPAIYETDAALARAIGTSRSNVTRWRAGIQSPSMPVLLRLAQATGTSIETLARIAGYSPEGDAR
jgi:hypothetical protein